MSSAGSSRVILIALLANLSIAVAKFIGAWISMSASLLAEAIHSVVDCANQVLLMVGSNASKKAPTRQHPLGYGREAYFWSFVVAILLFSMGGLFAVYEGIHKLQVEHEVSSSGLVLGILAFGLILESISFRACWQEVRKQSPHGSIWEWFRSTTAAELLVVFTEDAAALLGLIIATVFVSLSWYTNNHIWDAIGSILVGVLLVIVAVLLATEIKSLIIGEAPSKNYLPEIARIVNEVIPQGRIIRFIGLQMGPEEVLVSYKIMPGQLQRVDELIDAINLIEVKVKAKFSEVKWQFVEPDFRD